MFGLYLLKLDFLHGNVEKRNDFGLDFYGLVMYSEGKWIRKTKTTLK